MMGTVGTNLVSAAAMCEGLMGWSFWLSVGVTVVVVAIYTTSGGLKAVVFTDILSCLVLIAGAGLICLEGLSQVGGFTGLQQKVAALDWTEHHLHMVLPADHPEFPWPAVLLGLGFVMGPAYWIGNQAIVQRTLGTKSQNQARASYIFCALIKLVFPVLLVLPGVLAVALFHEELGKPGEGWQSGSQVLPLLVSRLLRPGVMGIVIGAFLVGVISNLDAYVNSASTMLVTDLYKPFVPGATDKQCLRIGQWLVIVLLGIGAVGSYLIKTQFGSVFEAFQVLMTFFQGPLLALLLLGMLTRRATAPGGLVGMVTGVATAVLLHAGRFVGPEYAISYLWVAWWSFAAALGGTIVVSLFTRPYGVERLRGLVCWIPLEKEQGI